MGGIALPGAGETGGHRRSGGTAVVRPGRHASGPQHQLRPAVHTPSSPPAGASTAPRAVYRASSGMRALRFRHDGGVETGIRHRRRTPCRDGAARCRRVHARRRFRTRGGRYRGRWGAAGGGSDISGVVAAAGGRSPDVRGPRRVCSAPCAAGSGHRAAVPPQQELFILIDIPGRRTVSGHGSRPPRDTPLGGPLRPQLVQLLLVALDVLDGVAAQLPQLGGAQRVDPVQGH